MSKAELRLTYRGSSMSPTLQQGDLLYVKPCSGADLKLGDVVVFRTGENTLLTSHRMVRRCHTGIFTRGDNNPHIDSNIVPYKQVIGVATYVQRGRTMRPIRGSIVGHLLGSVRGLRCSIIFTLKRVLYGPYRYFSSFARFNGRFTRLLPFKVVAFNSAAGTELQLLLGRMPIGLLMPGQKDWYIKPPFRLLVDEASLPKN